MARYFEERHKRVVQKGSTRTTFDRAMTLTRTLIWPGEVKNWLTQVPPEECIISCKCVRWFRFTPLIGQQEKRLDKVANLGTCMSIPHKVLCSQTESPCLAIQTQTQVLFERRVNRD